MLSKQSSRPLAVQIASAPVPRHTSHSAFLASSDDEQDADIRLKWKTLFGSNGLGSRSSSGSTLQPSIAETVQERRHRDEETVEKELREYEAEGSFEEFHLLGNNILRYWEVDTFSSPPVSLLTHPRLGSASSPTYST
jgi:hypothetical protein